MVYLLIKNFKVFFIIFVGFIGVLLIVISLIVFNDVIKFFCFLN